MNLSQILQARWFPQVSTHLLVGLAASGVIYGLRALGITNVVPAEVNAALTPLIGFLVAAIVHRAGTPGAAAPVPSKTIGSQVSQMLLDEVAQVIDQNPELTHELAAKALQQVLNPPAVWRTSGIPPTPPIATLTQAQEATQDGVIK